MYLVYPPKLCITVFLDFSWDDCVTQEKLETIETLRYPEIGVRVTGSAMFFSFCGDVIDLTR